MKMVISTLVLVAGLGLAVGQAQAAPGVGSLPERAGVTLVSGGCGPYGHRDGYGYCRPNRPPPPPVYRGCPPRFHPTPYGCRRNY